VPTVTLANLEQQVWDRLDSNSNWYPELNVRYALNEGLKKSNLIVGWNQATINVSGNSVANQYLYSTPIGIVVPMRVEFAGRELNPVGLKSLTRKYRNWISDTSNLIGPVKYWSRIGISQFLLYPADSIGGSVVAVTGIAPVPMLVNQGDVVDLENHWTQLVVKYAAARCQLKDSGATFSMAQGIMKQVMIDLKLMSVWKSMEFPQEFALREGR